MSQQKTARYCASPEALAAMQRDGLGWGHDLDCGCFYVPAAAQKPGPIARIKAKWQGKV